MSRSFDEVYPERAGRMFVSSDPPGVQLGSGGGTARLLLEAYRAGRQGESFHEWLDAGLKIIIHGSGESRRLQAYSAEGKPMMPLPHMPGFPAQAPLPVLLDLQVGSYSRIARLAPENYAVMVACGDVYLSFSEKIPTIPASDVLFVGMPASPAEAQHHGVMICHASRPAVLKRYLQKPSAETIASLDSQETYFLDTGVWLFSRRAMEVLLSKCDVDSGKAGSDPGLMPGNYDMFSSFGPAFGESPIVNDADMASLSCSVLPLPDSRFYHFGSCRSILASTAALLHPAEDKRSFANESLESFGSPIITASTVKCELMQDNRHIWIDNSSAGSGWKMKWNHIITGVPGNDWQLDLPAGACLSVTPVPAGSVLRFYGFDDPMRGTISAGNASILGRPLTQWLEARGLSAGQLGIDAEMDVYDMPLFPVLEEMSGCGDLVQWLVQADPRPGAEAEKYAGMKRISAREVLVSADLPRARASRMAAFARDLEAAGSDAQIWSSYCRERDLAVLARMVKGGSARLPGSGIGWRPGEAGRMALGAIHERMLRYECGAGASQAEAYSMLRDLVVREMEIAPIEPRRNLMNDQLVWGRCPLRLDIAGGWSDTPPYCMEYGGRVVNLAVDLNGQPPIQVFGRINNRKDILLRSIDLGVTETIPSYDELLKPEALGSEFGIAKAALALIGFDPRFHRNHKYRTLQNQLDAEFGGGIELSMVCAVPKGSGLGTSSMLAATTIGALNEMCGLGMDKLAISRRTLALEQLLTSGGGWQDQLGGINRGLKLLTTRPSIMQDVEISWLPSVMFEDGNANRTVLLYYTGITRVAHGILGEIVRNVFLNSSDHISIVRDISANAEYAAEAFQRNNWSQACDAVNRSWRLNQLLDRGTNPGSVQRIIDSVGDYLAACKLLGAGGGGYLLMFAKDEEAGQKIRQALESSPPGATSRFVELTVSDVGLQVTKS